MMKVILREDVPNLGVVGDIVSVRDGYARNYLIPQRKAQFASVRSVRELEHQKRAAAHHRKQATARAELDRRKVESLAVCLSAKVAPPPLSDDGTPIVEKLQKLFGSITNRDIAQVLRDSGVRVDHRRIKLEEAIRTVGKYMAAIRLDGGVIAHLPFWVIPENAPDIEIEKKRVEAAQEAVRQAKAKTAEAAAASARQEEESKAEEAAPSEASEADGQKPDKPAES